MVIKSRRLRWGVHIARMEEGGRAFKILTDKPKGKRPSERLRWSWEDSIRMDIIQIDINTNNRFDSPQDRNYSRALGKRDIEPPGFINHRVSWLCL